MKFSRYFYFRESDKFAKIKIAKIRFHGNIFAWLAFHYALYEIYSHSAINHYFIQEIRAKY